MLSMMLRATGSFRSRNPGRDMATDAARLAGVRQAVEAAIADAERERSGLQRRLDIYLAKASSLMDETGEFARRAREDEAELRVTEQHIADAKRRLAALAAEVARFEAMLEMVDGSKAEVA